MKFLSLALLACSLFAQSTVTVAYQPFLRSSNHDEVKDCFEKCGRKDVDKAEKIEDCQMECVEETVATGKSRSAIGPRGADTLLLCGSTCAARAEEKYDNKRRNFKGKDCNKKCDKDNEECKKKCKDKEKDAEKRNKKNAEDGAEEKYKNCNDKCFEEGSFFDALKSFKSVSGDEDLEKCFMKCGDKDPDDADKIEECQLECVDDVIATGRSRSSVGPRGADELLVCGADCAEEAEDEFDKEKRDAKRDIKDLKDEKDCAKKCTEDDEECEKKCEKAVKDLEKELKRDAEDEAEDEAEKKYERCSRKCFEPDVSYFKLGYVA